MAGEAKSTFFNISASSLMSKNLGEGEKLVKTLFAVARARQPSIVFIDEIDSLLTRRSSDEHEASRRLKTEFMVQFNSLLDSSNKDRVVVIGATNVPEDIDEAVLRRLSRKVYIGLPDANTRKHLIKALLKKGTHKLSNAQITKLVKATDGYSCSDLKYLCVEAAMGPVRDMGYQKVANASQSDIPPINHKHFLHALEVIPPSVTPQRLRAYQQFNEANSISAHERTASMQKKDNSVFGGIFS